MLSDYTTKQLQDELNKRKIKNNRELLDACYKCNIDLYRINDIAYSINLVKSIIYIYTDTDMYKLSKIHDSNEYTIDSIWGI